MEGARRLSAVWIALLAATVVAVVLGEAHDSGGALATVLVLAVAVAKVHVVATWFMGLRRAPRVVALALHAWTAAVVVVLSAIHLIQR